MTPRMYKTAEVCAILGTTRTTVRAMVTGGVLESPLRGKISIRSLETFLEDGRSWREIAAELDGAKRAALKAKAPNGKKRKQATGDGASDKTGKVTAFPILTATGRQKNLLD